MNYVADILLVAIFLVCLFSGWRRGFVRTVMNLISVAVAGIGAYFLYPFPAAYMYGKVFLPKMTSMVEESILSGSTGHTLTELFNSKPGFFVDTLNQYSDLSKVEGYFNTDKTMTVTDISEYTAAPIASALSNVLGFMLMFVVLIIIMRVLTWFIDKACMLPVLHGTNTLLGIVAGGVLGFFAAWITASVIAGVLPTLHAYFPEAISRTALEDSFVLKWLYCFNPVKFIQLF